MVSSLARRFGFCIASQQQGDLRLSGPLSGHDAGGGAQVHYPNCATNIPLAGRAFEHIYDNRYPFATETIFHMGPASAYCSRSSYRLAAMNWVGFRDPDTTHSQEVSSRGDTDQYQCRTKAKTIEHPMERSPRHVNLRLQTEWTEPAPKEILCRELRMSCKGAHSGSEDVSMFVTELW
ncbi:hypothetical protein PoB_001958200 [Plakobranchus ocellatus]|uniref:Uncharacterized protein n=1 Tax=Plakobranchus ocellatus TaxID=259542 RepID=A0AAV3ZCN9_9GAST|nr:hypothetical protein PoB_001958200 [Plakobranchus ocellatus]